MCGCVCGCKHTDHHPTSFDVAFRQYGTSVYVPGILLCGCTPDTSNLGGRREEEIKDLEDGARESTRWEFRSCRDMLEPTWQFEYQTVHL